MLAAVEWEAVTLAGAFVLGAILAAIGVIRVMRAVLREVDREMRLRRERDRQDEG